MDPTFSALLAHWTNFYMLAAAGAAAFTGLLFVALAFHLDVISREEQQSLRTATKLVFTLFLTVFFVALLLLLPDQSPLLAGWIAGGSAVLALAVPGFELVLRLRARASASWPASFLGALLVPVILDLVLLRQGVAVGAGDTTALSTVPVVLALLLLAALLLAWHLLLDLARARTQLDAQDRNAARDRGTERQIRNLMRELRAQNRRWQETSRPPAPPRDGERTPRK